MEKVKFSTYDNASNEWIPLTQERWESFLELDKTEGEPFKIPVPEIQKHTICGEYVMTPLQLLWAYEIMSCWLPFNRFTKRYFAWKINRKLKKVEAWLEH